MTPTYTPAGQLARLRVLRRDGYRCQTRDRTGTLCSAPASHVRGEHDEELVTVCAWHRENTLDHAAAPRRPRATA